MAIVAFLIAVIAGGTVATSAAQAWVLAQPPPRHWDYAIAAIGCALAVPIVAGAPLGMYALPGRDLMGLWTLTFVIVLLTTTLAFARGAGRRGVRAAAASTFSDRVWFLVPVHLGVVIAGAVLWATGVFFFAVSRIH